MSDNYDDTYGFTNPNLDNPSTRNPYGTRWLENELEPGGFEVRGWGHGNEIYYGGAQFSWGQQPTCYRPSISATSPKSAFANYRYNGNSASENLSTVFNYQLPASPTSSPGVRTTNWTVETRQDVTNPTPVTPPSSGASTNQSGQLTGVTNGTIQGSALSANTGYFWRACGKGTTGGAASPPFVAHSEPKVNGFPTGFDTDEVWNCTPQNLLSVNKGPTPTIQNPGDPIGGLPSTQQCSVMSVKLDDPENDEVSPRFYVNWTDAQGRINSVSNADAAGKDIDAPIGPDLSTFNTGQVKVGSYTIAGQAQSYDANQTLADFIRTKVPKNDRSFLVARGTDRFGASDMELTDFQNASTFAFYDFDVPSYNRSTFKLGPAAVAAIRTAPNFGQPPAKKEFLVPNTDQPFNNTGTISDGQKVDVRLTLQNTGETTMKGLKLADYFGSVRDFETPTNIRMTVDGVSQPALTGTRAPVLTSVKSNHDDADTSSPDDPANTRDDGEVSYRIDYGSSTVGPQGGSTTPILPSQLSPGQTLTFTFTTTANRNRTLASDRTDVDNGNFGRSQDVGSTASPRPTSAPDPEGGVVDIGDVHTYARYQSDFCDPSVETSQNLDFKPGEVVAPNLSAQRGSVFSNSNITAYGGSGATYTVTAAGNITKFGSGDTVNGSVEGYDPSTRIRTGCTINSPAGGIDWRRAMIDNVAALKAGPITTIQSGQAPPGSTGNTFNLGNGGVFQTNGSFTMAPGADIQLSGVGTVIVNGDFNINANMTYANTQSSVGFIVLGNVTFGTNVTTAVGSYYVSDVDYAAPPVLDSNGCPKLNVGKGKVTTGKAPVQLKIDGLMVARYFDFGRYFANPQTVTGPAEQVYYDGRVLNSALTPPGFTTFARNTSWYEITPGQ